MPAPERAPRHGTFSVRAKTGEDSYNEPIFSAPVPVVGRIVEGDDEMPGPDGTSIAISGTLLADEVFPIGSEVTAAGKARRIVSVKETQDIKGREVKRRYGLGKD